MHIGIILDGNRRFAKKENKNSNFGHEEGAKRVEELFGWGDELGIKEFTLYCFSMENFNRTKKEVDFLINLFKRWFKKMENDKRIEKNKVQIKFIGERKRFDKEMQELMRRIENKTKKNNNFRINFALGYGGRQEIISAIKKLVKSKKQINEKNFQNFLWLKDEPDFIIRTGGDKRTSNFLIWQSIYSEWIFIEKVWPEFTKKDLESAINEFRKRERRFGR